MQRQIKNRTARLLEILAVITIYVATARIGQIFSIEPGNVTPVWITSGIMLAWVLLRGYYIWPGIFLGAFFDNSWAYFSTTATEELLSALFEGFFNGLGDTLCAIAAVALMLRYFKESNQFKSLHAFLGLMVFGVVLGPLVSALFGVTSLWLIGILRSEAYRLAFLTWWLGVGVGVLLLTPLILAFAYPEDDRDLRPNITEASLFVTTILLYPILVFGVSDNEFLAANSTYILLPILFWAVIRFGLRISFSVALYVTICLIGLEYMGAGAFQLDDSYYRIVSLQFFVLTTISSIFIIGSLIADSNRSYRLLQTKNQHDALTQIYNRQYFDQQLLQEIARKERTKKAFSIIMYDIDFFKKVNDKHGHQAGDEVLIKLSDLVAKKTRDIDTLARWGGEEFMILMPETNAEEAALVAERIRAAVERTELIPHECITISLGVVEASPERKIDVLNLLNRLDAALYLAKNSGRNQVQVAQGS